MKNALLLLFCLMLRQGLVYAQVCDDKNIRTDPLNSYTSPGVTSPTNPEKSTATNRTNWRLDPNNTSQFVFTPPPSVFNPNPTPISLNSPWHVNSNSLSYFDLARGTNSDYHPSDGWELFKVNLGRLNDDVTHRNMAVTVPYIILYNKYEGKLRFFGYLSNPQPNQSIAIKFSYEKTTDNNGLNVSAFLSPHGETAQALDQQTRVIDITSVAQYTNDVKYAFWTDFPVAYDPCVCDNKSNLTIDFTGLSKQEINMTGTIEGTIKPVISDDGFGNAILKLAKTGATIATYPSGQLHLV